VTAVAGRFLRKRAPARVALVLADGEERLLRDLLGQVGQLVAPEPPADGDPLAALVGIGTATALPEDPVLARLFPDAYADDPDAAGDFRRYTEPGLRARKHADVTLALAALDRPPEGRRRERVLSQEESLAWLGALNDLRLALGTRIGVTEQWVEQLAALDDGDPRALLLAIYDWLSWLQETLVRALP
jgi:hypothetical protein